MSLLEKYLNIGFITKMTTYCSSEGIVFVNFNHTKPNFYNKKIHEHTKKEIDYLKYNIERKLNK